MGMGTRWRHLRSHHLPSQHCRPELSSPGALGWQLCRLLQQEQAGMPCLKPTSSKSTAGRATWTWT